MSLAYLNGRFVPLREAALPVWDRGVVQGATITERVRTFRHKPFLVEPHLDRLDGSIAATGLVIPESRKELAAIIDAVVEHETRLLDPEHDIGIVLFATAGPTLADVAAHGVEHRRTTCVHAAPLPYTQWAKGFREGQRLVIPPIRQIPPDVLNPQIKYRSRLHWYLADQMAHEIDPGASALLLDRDDLLTETSAGNLFVVRGGELLTPSATITLSGISQAYVRQMAGELGLPTRTADLRVDDLWTAEEAMTSSSSYCLMPVTAVDGRAVGSGKPGPVFDRLISEWSRRVGVDIRGQAERFAHK